MSKCDECEWYDIPEEIRKDTIKCNVCKLNAEFRNIKKEFMKTSLVTKICQPIAEFFSKYIK